MTTVMACLFISKAYHTHHLLTIDTMIHVEGIVPCISLLKQHVRTMLMMDPENYLINTSEQMNRSIDIILARENKSGSLARHLISTLQGLMTSSLSTERDEAVDEAVESESTRRLSSTESLKSSVRRENIRRR